MEEWIRATEESWLNRMHSHIASLFSGTFLPSHDESHHLRVWTHCKNILKEAAVAGVKADPDLVEPLLHAALFHDAGMSADPGQVHGELGARMYASFVRNPHPEAVKAIRLHDDKKALHYPVIEPGSPLRILDVLSLADDIDALGNIGIYRYAEIYLHRDIPLDELGIRILENASHRFRNISGSSKHLPSLPAWIRKEFECLQDFYQLYNQQLLLSARHEEVRQGPLGVINAIRNLSLESGIRPEDFSAHIDPLLYGQQACKYFKDLSNELVSA